MADIRIKDLPLATGPTTPTGADFIALDGLTTRKTSITTLGDVAVPIASQAESEAGVNAVKRMTPLTTKQSIASEVGDTIASAAQGVLAGTALQPGDVGNAAYLDVGSSSNTVAAGDDTRIVNSAQYVSGLVSNWSGSSGTDNYSVLQSALDSGRFIIIPPGKYAYSGTLKQSVAGQVVIAVGAEFYWLGMGDGSSSAFLMYVAMSTATGGEWQGGYFDHRASNWASSTSGAANNNRALEGAIMIMADQFIFNGVRCVNSFDNGIGVMRADLITGVQSPGLPQYCKVNDCHTFNCGIGNHTHDTTIGPHQSGSGVNNLTGSFATISNCTDNGSITNFIADYGGGASGVWEGCQGNNAKRSINGSVSFEGETVKPGGFGFYVGSSNHKFVGCSVSDCEGWAAWFDGYSSDCDIDISVKHAKNGGILIQGGRHVIRQIRIADIGWGSPGSYPAMKIRGSFNNGSAFIDSPDIIGVGPLVTGNNHSYGVQITTGPSGQKVFGSLVFGKYSGTLSPVANSQTSTFTLVAYRDAAFGQVDISDDIREFRRENASSTSFAFGDSGYNGNLFLSSSSNPAKRLAMGYDPVNDWGVLQAIQSGIATKRTAINPAGGGALIGLSGVGSYANDAAASSAGVPIGGIYRNGSALQIRVT